MAGLKITGLPSNRGLDNIRGSRRLCEVGDKVGWLALGGLLALRILWQGARLHRLALGGDSLELLGWIELMYVGLPWPWALGLSLVNEHDHVPVNQAVSKN